MDSPPTNQEAWPPSDHPHVEDLNTRGLKEVRSRYAERGSDAPWVQRAEQERKEKEAEEQLRIDEREISPEVRELFPLAVDQEERDRATRSYESRSDELEQLRGNLQQAEKEKEAYESGALKDYTVVDYQGKYYVAPTSYDGKEYDNKYAIIAHARKAEELLGPFTTSDAAAKAAARFVNVKRTQAGLDEMEHPPSVEEVIENKIRERGQPGIDDAEWRYRRERDLHLEYYRRREGDSILPASKGEVGDYAVVVSAEQELDDAIAKVESDVDSALFDLEFSRFNAGIVAKRAAKGLPPANTEDTRRTFVEFKRGQSIRELNSVRVELGLEPLPMEQFHPAGFWESFGKGVDIPFVGIAIDATEAGFLVAAAERVEAGTGTEEDNKRLLGFWADMKAEELQGRVPYLGTAGAITGESLTFMAEILATRNVAGLGAAGTRGALKGGTAVVSRSLRKVVGDTLKKAGVKKGAGRTGKIIPSFKASARRGGQTATGKAVGTVGGELVRTPYAGGSRIIEGSLSEMMPTLSVDDSEELTAVLESEVGDMDLLRSFANTYIEYVSERTGIVLNKAMKKAGAEAVANRVKAHVATKWLRLNPNAGVREFGDTLLSRGAYHGIIGEDFEEWVGMVGRYGVDLATLEEGAELHMPGLEEWVSRLIAFGIPSGTVATTSAVAGGFQRKQATGAVAVAEGAAVLRARSAEKEGEPLRESVVSEFGEVDADQSHVSLMVTREDGHVLANVRVPEDRVDEAEAHIYEQAEGLGLEGVEVEQRAPEAVIPEAQMPEELKEELPEVAQEELPEEEEKAEPGGQRLMFSPAEAADQEVAPQEAAPQEAEVSEEVQQDINRISAAADAKAKERGREVSHSVRVVPETEQDATTSTIVSRLSKGGVTVVPVDVTAEGGPAVFRGVQSPTNSRVIYVQNLTNLKGKEKAKALANNLMALIGHEVTHVLESVNPKLYEYIISLAPGEIHLGIEKYRESALGGEQFDEGSAEFKVSEGIAVAIESMLKEGKLGVASKEAGMFGQFKAWANGLVNRLGLRGQFAEEAQRIVDQLLEGKDIADIELGRQEAGIERAREFGLVPSDLRKGADEVEAEAAPRFAPAPQQEFNLPKTIPGMDFVPTTAEIIVKGHAESSRKGYLSPLPSVEDLNAEIRSGDTIAIADPSGNTGYLLRRNEGGYGWDMQALYSNDRSVKGAGVSALVDGIARGATTLDAFEGYLTALYHAMNFRETHRTVWSDEFKPPAWDYTKDGRPDVVLMTYVGETTDAREIAEAYDPYNRPDPGSNYFGDWPSAQERDERALREAVPERPREGAATAEPVGEVRDVLAPRFAPAPMSADAQARANLVSAREVVATGGKNNNIVLVRDIGLAINGVKNDYEDAAAFESAVLRGVESFNYQMQQSENGLNWYSEVIANAYEITSAVYPELRNDPVKRAVFAAFVAPLSNSIKARENWDHASHAYGTWKETGKIPRTNVNGNMFGPRGNTIATQLGLLEHMLNTMGERGLVDFLTSPHTLKELRDIRRSSAQDESLRDERFPKANNAMYKVTPSMALKGKAKDEYLGGYIFGEKIGPFFLNIFGLDETTIDVWAHRLFTREFGELLLNPSKETGLNDAPTPRTRPHAKRYFEEIGKRTGVKPQEAQAVLWYFEQQLYNSLGVKTESTDFVDGANVFVNTPGVAVSSEAVESGVAGTKFAPAEVDETPEEREARLEEGRVRRQEAAAREEERKEAISKGSLLREDVTPIEARTAERMVQERIKSETRERVQEERQAGRERRDEAVKRARSEMRETSKERLASVREKHKESLRTQLSDLRVKMKAKAASVESLRKNLEELVESQPNAIRSEVRDRLPKQFRWANIKTLKGLESAYRKVDQAVNEVNRRNAISRLKKALSSFSIDKLRPEFKEEMKAIIGSLGMSRMTEGAERQLRSFSKFLDRITSKQYIESLTPEEQVHNEELVLLLNSSGLKSALIRLEQTPVSDLTEEQANAVTDAIGMVLKLNSLKNKIVTKRGVVDRAKRIARIIKELNNASGTYAKDIKTREGRRVFDSSFIFNLRQFFGITSTSQLQPDLMADLLSGGANTAFWQMMYRDIADAYDGMIRDYYESQDYLREVLAELGIDVETSAGTSALTRMSMVISGQKGRRLVVEEDGTKRVPKKVTAEMHTIELPGEAGSIQVTEAELIDLLCTFQDMDTVKWLLSKNPAPIHIKNSLEERDVTLTAADIVAIQNFAKGLNGGRSVVIADAMIAYANGPLAEAMEAWSVQAHGYSNVSEDTWWSRKRVRTGGKEEELAAVNIVQGGVDSAGIGKKRAGGSDPIEISDAFAKFSNLCWTTSGMNNLSPVMRAARSVLKSKEVSARLNRMKRGNRIFRYWNDLYDSIAREIVGGIPLSGESTAAMRSFRNKFAKGTLAVNPRVMAYQVVSLIQAASVMPDKYIGMAVASRGASSMRGTRQFTDPVEEEKNERTEVLMDRYSPFLRFRNDSSAFGLVNSSGGVEAMALLGTRPTGEWGMQGIQAFDAQAIRTIWRACEHWVDSEIESGALNIEIGSEEYYKEVAKRAETVVQRSQPTMDVLHSSGLSREAKRVGGWASLLTMFMSQRNKNINMMTRAALEARRGNVSGTTLKVPIYVGVLSPILLMTIAEMYWWALTGGDDDDFVTHMDKAFSVDNLGRTLLDINLGSLPIGDQLSALVQRALFENEDVRFYGAEMPVVGTIMDMFGDAGLILDAFNVHGFDDEEKKWDEVKSRAFDAGKDLALAVGQLTGMNVTPLARQVGQIYEKRLQPPDYLSKYREALREVTGTHPAKRTDEQWDRIADLKEHGVEARSSQISKRRNAIRSGMLSDEEVEEFKREIDRLELERQQAAAEALGIKTNGGNK